MFMKLTSFLALIAVSAALPLGAQTLILDDFDTADNTDLNADLSRQSGSLAPLDWSVFDGNSSNGSQTQIVGGELSIGGTSTGHDYSAGFDTNFGSNSTLVAGGQFQITFDLVQLASGSYTSFAMTGDPGLFRPAVDDSTEFGLLFRESNDDISIREGSGSAGSVDIAAASQLGEVVLTVTTDEITSGEDFTIGMTIAGNSIDLNGADAGSAFSGTWDSADLYLSLSSRSGISIFDNVSVTAIPEPGVFALLFGGVSLGWVLRRRSASK